MSEPGLDLPLALALASSLRDRPLVEGTVAIGEVGLLGELRPVGGLDRRLREAARLGFTRAIVPRSRARIDDGPAGVDLVVVGSLAEALRAALADPVTAVAERVYGSRASSGRAATRARLGRARGRPSPARELIDRGVA